MIIVIVIIIIIPRVRKTLSIYLHIYEDDITWPRAATQYFFESCKIFLECDKRDLVSPSSHVIFD